MAVKERRIARKEYHSIGEVCELVGLKPHVLRYWETQFIQLNPSKNRAGNRVYREKQIKLVMLLKQLLHEEKYTVDGAKRRLDELRRGGELDQAARAALDAGMIDMLRTELMELRTLLTPSPES